MSTKQDGDWGEALVEKYLSERGCRIVEREWRCRFGEIDLIAEKDGVLLFVEGEAAHQFAVRRAARVRHGEKAGNPRPRRFCT